MADWIKVRAISRSQQVRIGDTKVTRFPAVAVDLSVPRVRRDLERHMALGSVIVYGHTNALGTVVTSGGVVDQGVSATDLAIRVTAGKLRLNAGGVISIVAGTPSVTAADATNPRIDNVVVTDATGVVTIVAGTAAATPAAPAIAAGTTKLAEILVAANVTAIPNSVITDWTSSRIVVAAAPNNAVN